MYVGIDLFCVGIKIGNIILFLTWISTTILTIDFKFKSMGSYFTKGGEGIFFISSKGSSGNQSISEKIIVTESSSPSVIQRKSV